MRKDYAESTVQEFLLTKACNELCIMSAGVFITTPNPAEGVPSQLITDSLFSKGTSVTVVVVTCRVTRECRVLSISGHSLFPLKTCKKTSAG